jgi:hypothetical protein
MVIAAVAFCPHPPVLVPEVAQGAAAELDDLRAACVRAITDIASLGSPLVVVGGGPSSRTYPADARGSFAGFGVPLDVSLGTDAAGPLELPLSMTVGAWLVRAALGRNNGAVGHSVGPEGALAELPDGAALLVMGDGSARRSTAAPGYLDERAAAFDHGVASALGAGDAAALAALDPALGRDLLAAGVPVWRAVGARLAGTRYAAALRYEGAPYGVGYFVAAWT